MATSQIALGALLLCLPLAAYAEPTIDTPDAAMAAWPSLFAGGTPVERSPFVLDPADKKESCRATKKADYFLRAAKAGAPVVLIRSDDGKSRVYEIDGNLWIEDLAAYRRLVVDPVQNDGVQITFVITGNLYVKKDFLYEEVTTADVAFVMVADPKVEDSGNVYTGPDGVVAMK